MSKMMNVERRPTPTRAPVFCLGLASALLILTATTAFAQLPGTENGEWRYLGGAAGHTRSSTLDQINASNFEDLEVDWIWKSDNFGPNLDYFSRATPIYADGLVYSVATTRRQGEYTVANRSVLTSCSIATGLRPVNWQSRSLVLSRCYTMV